MGATTLVERDARSSVGARAAACVSWLGRLLAFAARGFLSIAERLGVGPGIWCQCKLGRHLLEAWRLGRDRRAPLRVWLLTDLLDVSDEIPDHRVGQDAAPGRHPIGAPLRDRQIDVCRLAAILKEAVAERRTHAAATIIGMAADAVERHEIRHAGLRRGRIIADRVLDVGAGRDPAGEKARARRLDQRSRAAGGGRDVLLIAALIAEAVERRSGAFLLCDGRGARRLVGLSKGGAGGRQQKSGAAN